ncbi:uncharacterized protein HMPREF1541_01817 [Cyphellophora europaea CBS 101466]|uniref:Uncharacterized protein n=1 Tax=Cyphellophora europaea (strain CBS 101466) TaxID=1220924 RepID=W2S248_CYPE1|nr:uncharacterized protein HMPREF1541_01817 [Cyphellophora europaea CBS 101466]ETN42660.1 hypothetical protein HMPREF1541_01817 [Cyphellophora europaea CBS 101466]
MHTPRTGEETPKTPRTQKCYLEDPMEESPIKQPMIDGREHELVHRFANDKCLRINASKTLSESGSQSDSDDEAHAELPQPPEYWRKDTEDWVLKGFAEARSELVEDERDEGLVYDDINPYQADIQSKDTIPAKQNSTAKDNTSDRVSGTAFVRQARENAEVRAVMAGVCHSLENPEPLVPQDWNERLVEKRVRRGCQLILRRQGR